MSQLQWQWPFSTLQQALLQLKLQCSCAGSHCSWSHSGRSSTQAPLLQQRFRLRFAAATGSDVCVLTVTTCAQLSQHYSHSSWSSSSSSSSSSRSSSSSSSSKVFCKQPSASRMQKSPVTRETACAVQ